MATRGATVADGQTQAPASRWCLRRARQRAARQLAGLRLANVLARGPKEADQPAAGSADDRLLAVRPALAACLAGQRVPGLARLRRNTALHAAGVPSGGFAGAPRAALAALQRGPRLHEADTAAGAAPGAAPLPDASRHEGGTQFFDLEPDDQLEQDLYCPDLDMNVELDPRAEEDVERGDDAAADTDVDCADFWSCESQSEHGDGTSLQDVGTSCSSSARAGHLQFPACPISRLTEEETTAGRRYELMDMVFLALDAIDAAALQATRRSMTYIDLQMLYGRYNGINYLDDEDGLSVSESGIEHGCFGEWWVHTSESSTSDAAGLDFLD